jgi:GNAT superfamily N-acetyltransferase
MRTSMDTGRAPLFCDTGLAQRIERTEAMLMRGCVGAAERRTARPGFAIPLAGGMATFADVGSPCNKVVGLGFAGVPSAGELDEIEHAFAGRGTAVQVELAHLGDPAIAEVLTGRGYRLVSFENVLGRLLSADIRPETPAGVEVRLSGDDEFQAWLDVVAEGVAEADTEGVASHEQFEREAIDNAERDFAAAGLLRYAAVREGVLAGGASLHMAKGVAQLGGAATAPHHRHRGIHSALISVRLADAAAAGCDVAVVTTQPGSRSQRNVQARGFDLLYTRAVLVKRSNREP